MNHLPLLSAIRHLAECIGRLETKIDALAEKVDELNEEYTLESDSTASTQSAPPTFLLEL